MINQGVKIYYDVVDGDKSKDSLVFLHGLGGDSAAWDEVRLLFQEQNTSTVAIDIRGCGLSDRPGTEGSYDFARNIEDLLLVIEKENIHSPTLVGHCYGGMIAMCFAAEHPDKVKNLILIETDFKPPHYFKPVIDNVLLRKIVKLLSGHTPGIHFSPHRDFSVFKGGGDFDWKRILSDVTHTSLKSYLLIADNLVNYNAVDLLEKITMPTLIISGMNDSVFPPSVEETLHRNIKQSHINYIDDSNHIVVITNPKGVFEKINTFIGN